MLRHSNVVFAGVSVLECVATRRRIFGIHLMSSPSHLRALKEVSFVSECCHTGEVKAETYLLLFPLRDLFLNVLMENRVEGRIEGENAAVKPPPTHAYR